MENLEAEVLAQLEEYFDVDQRKEKAERLLSEKYQENFVAEYVRQEMFEEYYAVQVYAEHHPHVMFLAYVDAGQDENGISDEYVARRVADRMAEQILQNIGMLRGMYYVVVIPMDHLILSGDPEVPFTELSQQDAENRYTVELFASPEEDHAQDIYHALEQAFTGLEFVTGEVELYYGDETLLEQVQEYVETHTGFYEEYKSMIEPYFAGSIPVEKGKLRISEQDFMGIGGDRT